MSADVPVVWLAEGQIRDGAARALVSWARAHGVVLMPAEDGPMPDALSVDLGLATVIGAEIDRAHEAIASMDTAAAEGALTHADALLRDHPELPNAPWLRAEAERTWSARFMRLAPRDEARAEAAWQHADALDGGRLAGVGEKAAPARPRTTTSLVVSGGAGRRLVVRLDGNEIAPRSPLDSVYPVEVVPAEHHVAVWSDGSPAFASWVTMTSGADVAIAIDLGHAGACMRAPLASATRKDGGVDAHGIACEAWVAAIPGEREGTVLVARCARDTCSPLVEWRLEPLVSKVTPLPKRERFPAWAKWTIAGAGAATATFVVLAVSGAFAARPTEQRFVSGAARVE